MSDSLTSSTSQCNSNKTDLPLYSVGSELRVLDTDLGERLGYARPSKIRELIKTHEKNLKEISQLPAVGRRPDTGGREVMEYYLDRKQAIFVCMKSETDNAIDVQMDIVRVYDKHLSGQTQAQVPQDYISALKALVASEEAKLLVNQKVVQLEHQIEETRPLTEIGQAMVGQTTMIVRDWVAMMKKDYGNSVKERKVRDLLHDLGYLYWTQTEPRVARAYAQFDHLFKLEVEVCSGYPRPVLKITGEGIRQLTPIVVKKFGLTPVTPL